LPHLSFTLLNSPTEFSITYRSAYAHTLISCAGFSPLFGPLWYISRMFRITKHAEGKRGSFVKLVHLDTEDFAVIARSPSDGRLHHKYIGPDLSEAEEVFDVEIAKLTAAEQE
jgi:hypothetical protein